MKCPFNQDFPVDCPYLKKDECGDIYTNAGNGDAWCLDRLCKNSIVVVDMEKFTKLFNAIREDAAEWSVDYKPFNGDCTPGEYASYGFEEGQKKMLQKILKIEVKKDLLGFKILL